MDRRNIALDIRCINQIVRVSQYVDWSVSISRFTVVVDVDNRRTNGDHVVDWTIIIALLNDKCKKKNQSI